MARYERTYSGERRTVHLGVQLTPSERAELETAAANQGANLSAYVRELCLRRSAAVVAATRRNPEAKAIITAIDAAARELKAVGINLNQIAFHANSTGDLELQKLVEALADFHDA